MGNREMVFNKKFVICMYIFCYFYCDCVDVYMLLWAIKDSSCFQVATIKGSREKMLPFKVSVLLKRILKVPFQ